MLCVYNQSYLTRIKWGINKMSQELELIEMCILNKRLTFMTFSKQQKENQTLTLKLELYCILVSFFFLSH